MKDESDGAPSPAPLKIRFSIGTLLLWIVIGVLAINSIVMNRNLVRVEREITQSKRKSESQLPLTPDEVSRQFEENTARRSVATKVKDVRYSPEADAYRVSFSYFDSADGTNLPLTITLNHDGFGVYSGTIKGGPLIESLEQYSEFHSFVVSVETPSSLGN